jgi:hypothetical protein
MLVTALQQSGIDCFSVSMTRLHAEVFCSRLVRCDQYYFWVTAKKFREL